MNEVIEKIKRMAKEGTLTINTMDDERTDKEINIALNWGTTTDYRNPRGTKT